MPPPNPIEINKDIGWRIRQCREELGISRETLGKAVGVSHSQIAMYENGSEILVSRLYEICWQLKLHIDVSAYLEFL
ncbi:MAG: helix-turn-helix transcriptional regulator [Pseudomonadota bacterium]